MIDIQDRLLTARECAGYLGVSPDTVRTMVQRGDLEGYRLNGDWRTAGRSEYRIPRSALETMMKTRKVR